jgi:hypothetical protein
MCFQNCSFESENGSTDWLDGTIDKGHVLPFRGSDSALLGYVV